MAKKNAAQAVPSMRGYKSDRRPKGAQYLDGKQKDDMLSRMRAAFKRVKIKVPA